MSDWANPAVETSLSALKLNDVGGDTIAVSGRRVETEQLSEPMVTPIHRTSIYRFNSVEHYEDVVSKGAHFYSRLGNPTKESVECTINALEGGAGSLTFSSGSAAISVVLMTFLRPGDHIVAPNPSYSGTVDFVEKILVQFGVESSWVKGGCPVEDYKKLIKPNTKVLYVETPCNPSIVITDLEEFGKLGVNKGVITVVDSTFASPSLQQPIKYGVDIVLHSCSKYMGGHSDLIGGCVTAKTLQLWRRVHYMRGVFGSVMSPDDASLLHRGIKTLPLRMQRHSSNGQAVAEFLEKHPKVALVMYPGLPSHPGHVFAKKQMSGFGGMIMLKLKGGASAGRTFVNSLKLIQIAESLGGVESIVELPAAMTHGPIFMTSEGRAEGGITDDMIRLSVGIENVKDLMADLIQALEKVN